MKIYLTRNKDHYYYYYYYYLYYYTIGDYSQLYLQITFLDVVCLYRRHPLCRTLSRLPRYIELKLVPLVNFFTYLPLTMFNFRLVELFLFSLVCLRYRETFVLRGIVVLKWFALWTFRLTTHARHLFKRRRFSRSLDACSVFDRRSMSRKTHCS